MAIPSEGLLFDIKCVSFKGLKSLVQFKPKDIIMADDEVFVRLCPRNTSLISAVLEGNDRAPEKALTLTCCDGMSELTKLRNSAQAAALQSPEACTLFSAEKAPKSSKARISHKVKKLSRDNFSSISVKIPEGCSVDMIRPVHGRDNLVVRYDAEMLASILQFLRNSEFSQPTQRDEALAHYKGIWKRKHGFLVAMGQAPEGRTPPTKFVKTWDEALNLVRERGELAMQNAINEEAHGGADDVCDAGQGIAAEVEDDGEASPPVDAAASLPVENEDCIVLEI